MPMNEISRPLRSQHATTQAADGLPRLAWTVEEFDKLAEHGFFAENDRIELIGGELVPMSPKGNRHELVRDELQDAIVLLLPRTARLSSEIGWRPDGKTYLEPDIIVYPRGFSGVTVAAKDLLLLIEVADTSIKFDSVSKANVYASLGVPEYWVVNAKTLETIVHLEPGEHGYGKIATFAPSETLAPLALPALSLSLGALKIE
jgi:Uma2 family endonuclease